MITTPDNKALAGSTCNCKRLIQVAMLLSFVTSAEVHRFLKHWDPEQPPPCQCGGHAFFPSQTIRQTGHLFASMLDIFPYTCLAHLNLEDCAWPTSRQWMEQGQQTFYRWKERWKLPNRFKHMWDLALHQAWESHLLQLRKHTVLDVARHRSLHQEIRMMKRFVLCPADHHPHQTFVACPLHYHTLLQKTYFQTDVFEPCTVGPLALRDRLVQLAKQDLPTFLQSLINAEGTLPYAYILPKPSKAFEALTGQNRTRHHHGHPKDFRQHPDSHRTGPTTTRSFRLFQLSSTCQDD